MGNLRETKEGKRGMGNLREKRRGREEWET